MHSFQGLVKLTFDSNFAGNQVVVELWLFANGLFASGIWKVCERLGGMWIACCEGKFEVYCLVKAVLLQCFSHVNRWLESQRFMHRFWSVYFKMVRCWCLRLVYCFIVFGRWQTICLWLARRYSTHNFGGWRECWPLEWKFWGLRNRFLRSPSSTVRYTWSWNCHLRVGSHVCLDFHLRVSSHVCLGSLARYSWWFHALLCLRFNLCLFPDLDRFWIDQISRLLLFLHNTIFKYRNPRLGRAS